MGVKNKDITLTKAEIAIIKVLESTKDLGLLQLHKSLFRKALFLKTEREVYNVVGTRIIRDNPDDPITMAPILYGIFKLKDAPLLTAVEFSQSPDVINRFQSIINRIGNIRPEEEVT